MNKVALPYNDITTGLDPNIIRRASMAIKALATGTCQPEEQKYILEFIITKICRTYDSDWFPGDLEGDRTSSFAAGRRHVGRQLAILLEFKVGTLKDK